MSVKRIFVVKKAEHACVSSGLLSNLKVSFGLERLESIKILNRYDVEGLTDNDLNRTLHTVFAENMVDDLYLETYPFDSEDVSFAVEYLPGQYDMRADSAEQCVKVITNVFDVAVQCAKVYVLKGNISSLEVEAIKDYIVNKVDERIASMLKPTSLARPISIVEKVGTINGFIERDDEALKVMLKSWGLAMSLDDLKYTQNHFRDVEKRDITETEIKLLDTYWSDHCRHTTFNTKINDITIDDGKYQPIFNDALSIYKKMREDVYGSKNRDITLMDIAVIGMKYARKNGMLDNLEVSDENNACSIEIDVDTNEGVERWLLQFKNETHNHPTEIEPFGGAATCLGGAIRDPLSGRAYVYHAMRITGSADPRQPVSKTLQGKLPQRKITREAANGFSSYGNQIGLATGYVQEHYHEGYSAKRMEVGAVVGAVAKNSVIREKPSNKDLVILLGGRTGRDGIGGATGSSKEHDITSIEICGAEVQKGNAPEEHKIQRLFRKKNVTLMVKKCNDFGAGGVGVAIGELADGLLIDLNNVPKKYDGLTGTEIAIAESQERMAVCISPDNLDRFMHECAIENLEATVVAEVTDSNRLQMLYDGEMIVDISRDFLDSAGVKREQSIRITSPTSFSYLHDNAKYSSFEEATRSILEDINICSQKPMVEQFDSTIGAGSVVTQYGGATGYSVSEYMACKIPVQKGDTTTISLMAHGFNPYLSSWSCFHGGFYAVIESISKIVAAGGKLKDIRLSFQEYFERLNDDENKWGKPFASLLGALKVQYELGLAAIGGKDSMSGTFKDEASGVDINVPPTLISFAVAPSKVKRIVTQELKGKGTSIYLVKTNYDKYDLINFSEYKDNLKYIEEFIDKGYLSSIYTIKQGGMLEALLKQSFGNMVGFSLKSILSLEELTQKMYGSFIIEAEERFKLDAFSKNIVKIGVTIEAPSVEYSQEKLNLNKLLEYWLSPLDKIFPNARKFDGEKISPNDFVTKRTFKSNVNIAQPRVAILALPGTNCEYDTKRAFENAGSHKVTPFIFRNRSIKDIESSCKEFAEIIRNSQILAVPGGFSAGDEPEGSGKFFVSVFKNDTIKSAINELITKRDGLIIGICNGFQALIKTGLLTYDEIIDLTSEDATLSFNRVNRHVSQFVRTRVCSVNSPWLNYKTVGDIDVVPVSHGEGRFTAPKMVVDKLFEQGQVIFQYVDLNGDITMDEPYNPNGSDMAIEGICSPSGRVIGKMAHSERVGEGIHLNNRYGNVYQKIFESGINYYK